VTTATNAEETTAAPPAGAEPGGSSAGTIDDGVPAAAPSRMPRVPLRITLVALMVVLVAVGLSATGITATSLLKDYLRGQQDATLAATVRTLQHDPSPFVIDLCTSGVYHDAPGYPYLACAAPGTDDVVAVQGPVDDESALPSLEEHAAEQAQATGPVTVASADGSRQWRVIGFSRVIGLSRPGLGPGRLRHKLVPGRGLGQRGQERVGVELPGPGQALLLVIRFRHAPLLPLWLFRLRHLSFCDT